MKVFVCLIVIAAAGVIGYMAEPSLRFGLTGVAPGTAPGKTTATADPRAEQISKIDLSYYTAEQYPKEVILKKDTPVTDSASGSKLSVPAGTKVKLLRLNDEGMLVISPGMATVEGAVQIHDTDIREQLLDNPPAPVDPTKPATPAAPPAMAATEKAPPQDMMAKGDPAGESAAPESAPAPPKPAETASADPSMKEPDAGPNAALKPEATPAPDPAAATSFAPMAADDIVKAMQDSIQSAQIKEVKFEQVSEWTAGEPETVDGKQFNTGMITYKGQTFLGVKNIQAKAYVNGGKVIRWIGAKSGMEIK
jgi:hypothetical protein